MNKRSCPVSSRCLHPALITRMLHLPHFVSAFLRSRLCSCLLILLFLSACPSPRTPPASPFPSLLLAVRYYCSSPCLPPTPQCLLLLAYDPVNLPLLFFLCTHANTHAYVHLQPREHTQRQHIRIFYFLSYAMGNSVKSLKVFTKKVSSPAAFYSPPPRLLRHASRLQPDWTGADSSLFSFVPLLFLCCWIPRASFESLQMMQASS